MSVAGEKNVIYEYEFCHNMNTNVRTSCENLSCLLIVVDYVSFFPRLHYGFIIFAGKICSLQVLCSKCCDMKAKLEYLGFEEARVCHSCHSILQRSKYYLIFILRSSHFSRGQNIIILVRIIIDILN